MDKLHFLSGKKIIILALVVAAFGSLFLLSFLKSKDRSNVIGIKSYLPFPFGYKDLSIRTIVPSNWYVEQLPLTEKEGVWLAFTGPMDKKHSQYTSLDCYLIKKNTKPEYQSLDAYAQYNLTQSSIGETEVLFNQKKKIAGYDGVEIKISFKGLNLSQASIEEYREVEQFAIIEKDNYFITVFYSATGDLFNLYLPAYEEFLRNLIIK